MIKIFFRYYKLLQAMAAQLQSLPIQAKSIVNKGIELTLNAIVYSRSDFKWTLHYKGSYNKSEIIKLDNLVGTSLANFPGNPSGAIKGDLGQTIQVRKVGQPVDVFYTYIQKYENGVPVPDQLGEPATNM